MNPNFQQDQSTLQRRIARRRFVALATLAALAAVLLSTSVISRATSLVSSVGTAVLRGADIVSDGPALADNHVAHGRRPASLNRSHAVTQAPSQASFPATPASGQAPTSAQPVAAGSEPIAVAPVTRAPVGAEAPAAEETSPPPKSEPPPAAEPDPEPPHSGPEPPHSEEPPKTEPEPPKVDPSEPVEEPAEEEPASEQPPATPAETPLFEGSVIDDFETVEAARGAITEVPDPLGSGETVLKMTVNDSDVYPITPTENPRAQAISPDMIENGDEFWLHTKFLLPQDFPSNIPGWVGLGSIYGEPFNGPSPWQLDIEGEHINWPRNSTYNWDVPWEMPIVKGQWITVLLHERFASDGWVEMWVNGQPITFFSSGSSYNPGKLGPTTHLEMKTMDKSNNGGPNAAKIANYRLEGMFKTLTVYFGPLRVGETRESVEG